MKEFKVIRLGPKEDKTSFTPQIESSNIPEEEDIEESIIDEPLVAPGLRAPSREEIIRQQQQLREQYQAPQQYQPTEGADIGLGGRIGLAALRGAELPGHILNKVAELIEGEGFIKKPLSQDIQESLGVSEEQLQPRGTIEKYAQRVAGQAPIAAFGGIPALARTAVSAVPAVAAGEAGAPEWLQDLIQFGSDIGLGVRSGRVKSPRVKPAQKAAYKTAKSLVSDAERPGATKIIESLTEVGKKLEGQVDPKIEKNVENIIKKVNENLVGIFSPGATRTKLGINPKKALELRRTTNTFARKNPQLYEYTEPIVKGINDFFTEYSASNPEFFNYLKKADQLTTARHMHSYIGEKLSNLPGLVKIPYAKEVVNDLLGKTVGEIEKFLRKLLGNDAAREVYLDAAKSVVEGNMPLAVENLKNVLDIFNEQESPSTKKSATKPFKVIRRGRA